MMTTRIKMNGSRKERSNIDILEIGAVDAENGRYQAPYSGVVVRSRTRASIETLHSLFLPCSEVFKESLVHPAYFQSLL